MNAQGLTTPKEKAQELQRALYRAAKKSPKRRFHALYDKVYRWDILWRAWERVKANRGSAGIDGQTLKAIEEQGIEAFLREIQEALQAGRYRPVPVKRTYIPKPDGRQRPLGIPTVRDRVVQMAAKIVLEPIFEADFKDVSYGFRPKRSAQQAVAAIKEASWRSTWVVDADIVGFFDNVNHEKLLILVQQRLSDRRMLKLIRQWLEAGVMEDGRYHESEVGTPQGGVISPLLANIYLNYLDTLWEKHCSHLGVLVRYADDLVVLCRTKRDAKKAMATLKAIFDRLDLEMHPEKTKLANLWEGQEGFDFLGFHHRKVRSRKGTWWLASWPNKKAMKKMREKVKEITAPRARLFMRLENVIAELNSRIRGWRQYYGIGWARRQFAALDWYILQRLNAFMSKKTRQKGSLVGTRRWNTLVRKAGLLLLTASASHATR